MRKLALFVLVLLLAVAAAGCGSDDDDNGEAGATTSAATTTSNEGEACETLELVEEGKLTIGTDNPAWRSTSSNRGWSGSAPRAFTRGRCSSGSTVAASPISR